LSNIFLIRHGLSFFNEKEIITGSLDIPLTNKGIKQSQTLDLHINCPLDIVFTSTLTRSLETATEFLRQHCPKYNKIPLFIPIEQQYLNFDYTILPIYKTNLINERNYGSIQGISKKQIKLRFSQEEINTWKTTMYAKPPGGECLEDVKRRTDLFYEKYLKKYLYTSHNIAIICHQNTIKTLRIVLNSNEFTNTLLKNCEIIKYTF
jgi:Fructose-2,6-bisphosphatase